MISKHKNYLLFLGFIILFWVCYKMPISQTLKAKKEYNELLQEHLLFSNTTQKVTSLNAENVYLDAILNKYQFSTDKSFQSNLLYTITSFSENHNLKVVTFEEPHIYKKNETKLNTYSFSIRGNFDNTLQLIYELEQVKKIGKLFSVNLQKKKNYRTNKKILETTILLQRLEN